MEFLLAMTYKEIAVRYRSALLGIVWMIINPFFQMLVIGFVFAFFFGIGDRYSYFLYLFSGLLPWQFFSQSLLTATQAFVQERQLLQKAMFPLEVLPLSIILANFFHFLVALMLFVIFLLVTGNLEVRNFLFLFPACVALFVFTFFSALLTSTLFVRYRDVRFIVQALLVVWFYATPVLYAITVLPPQFRFLFIVNPLSSWFEMFHSIILPQYGVTWDMLAANFILLVFGVTLSLWVFRRHRFSLVDWL